MRWSTGNIEISLVPLITDPCTPGFPFTGPYGLWDTRNWTGGSTVANEGSAGSMLNMTVINRLIISNTQNDQHTQASATSGDLWATMGGHVYCSSITWVVCTAAVREEQEQRSSTLADFNAGSGSNVISGSYFNGSYFTGPYPGGAFGAEDGTGMSVHAHSGPGVGQRSTVNWYVPYRLPGHQVFIMALDPYTGQHGLWIDGISMVGDAGYSTFEVIPGNLANLPAAGSASASFGYESTTPAFAIPNNPQIPLTTSGKWQRGVWAEAFYRGFPSAGDVAAITAYFW